MHEADVGRILLLDADARFRRAVRRAVSSFAIVAEADSCQAAARAIGERAPYDGFIVDVALNDGSGLEWLAAVRRSQNRAPALVLTRNCEPALVNRAFDLDARYLCKPFPRSSLRAFVLDALARRRKVGGLPTDAIAEFTQRWTREHRLTPNEAEIIAVALRGHIPRDELAARREISTNTLKTHVRRALKKLGAKSLAEVRDRALQAITTDDG